MASQEGYRDWTEFKVNEQAWLSGRVIGTGGNLLSNIPQEIPAIGGGVPTASGFYHQVTLASPAAPIGATAHSTWSWAFNPQLDEESARHVARTALAGAHGAVRLWHPWGTQDMWRIPSTLRTKWSLPHLLSGSTGQRGVYVEPIVDIVETDPAGLIESTLTFAASSPSSTEFSLDDTLADQDHITTGDLTAKAGKILSIFYWPLLRVIIGPMTQGLEQPGHWAQGFEFREAPPPRNYQLD